VSEEPTYEQLAEENAALRAELAELRAGEVGELPAMVAELSEQVEELKRRLGGGLVDLVASAVGGSAVGEEAGHEALVAEAVGA
jgi:ribosomal protein L29